MKCQVCKSRKAVWRVGSDGFGAKTGAKVCDNWSCRQEVTGGYPVTLHRAGEVAARRARLPGRARRSGSFFTKETRPGALRRVRSRVEFYLLGREGRS